jgi:sporulation protein YlmC with PRC-barrel domain
MLRTIESLYGRTVAARDGEIGTVDQIYFDDEAWGVRYLVVETGSWINKRKVLISPYSFKHADPGSSTVEVDLTQQQVKDSPNIDTDKPVSRQHETEYLGYYGYPTYWGGAYLWGVGAYPGYGAIVSGPWMESEARTQHDQETDNPPADVHLRSTKAVKGYHVEAADGRIGHICGFIVDDVVWAIRYLIVDTRNWWPGGKEVLLATQWINQTNWCDSTVSTELSREAIRNSPEYDDTVPLARSYEQALHGFYGKDTYWSKDDTESLLAHVGETAS